MKRALCAAAVALAASGPICAAAYQEVAVAGGGSVAGTVRFTGPIPAPVEMPVTKDVPACGTSKISEALVVGSTRGVMNAIVTIEGISAGKAFEVSKVPVLANRSCRYEPHVQVVPVGTRLQVENDDPILHNTHGVLDGSKSAFNIALPTKGRMLRKLLDAPGLIEVVCDAGHTWMKAFVLVSEHPYYAVTDSSGTFSIKDVPPGTYTMKVWHESLGTQTREVTVRPEATSDAVFEFQSASPESAPTGGAQPPKSGSPH